MYNAEQKTRFVKSFTWSVSVRDAALRTFNALERYEEEYGGDVVTMDLETLQHAFDQIAGVRSKSKRMPRYILREYSKWARENGIAGANDAAERLESASTDKLRNETVRNPKHLQSYLDVLFLPESEQTSDNNFRAWYWLGYSGMDDEDAMTVKTSEVDFISMTVTHNGFSYPIYREAVPALRNCVTLKQYWYKHPNYEPILRDRSEGDELLRGFRGVPSIGAVRVEFSRRQKIALDSGKLKTHLSFYKVWISGIFYRMYEDELAGIPVNFDDITNRKLGDKQFKLDSGRNTQQSKRAEISRDFRVDYERWKQTLP